MATRARTSRSGSSAESRRVFEIARDVGITSRELQELIRKWRLKLEVKNHMSVIPAERVEDIMERLAKAGVGEAPAKEAPAKKAPARKASAAKAPAKKADEVGEAPAKKAPARKAPARKTAAKKAEAAGEGKASEAAAKEAAPKKAPARKAPAKKAPARKAGAGKADDAAAAEATVEESAAKKAPAKKAPAKKAPARKAAKKAEVEAPAEAADEAHESADAQAEREARKAAAEERRREREAEVAEAMKEGLKVGRDWLTETLQGMGFERPKVAAKIEEDMLTFDISGKGMEDILELRNAAARTDLVESLQYLLSRVVSGKVSLNVAIDVDGFRRGRQSQLKGAAASVARFVKSTGRTLRFAGMNAFDRRAFHNALGEEQGVRTESDGRGRLRRLHAWAVGGKSDRRRDDEQEG